MNSAKILRFIRWAGLEQLARQTKQLLQKLHLWPKGGFGKAHRNVAYSKLKGRGLEVGALHCPANVPSNCIMEYCDAHTKEESIRLFPEIESYTLVSVNHIVDLDAEQLSKEVNAPYDFVIMNHVIEHVANPISVIEQLFSVVREDGFIIISAPDKGYTFDKNRPLTSFEHLWQEYQQGVNRVTDEHYLEFIQYVHPEIFFSDDAELVTRTLHQVRSRREHAHVWDSSSFLDFLQQTITHLGLNSATLYKSMGQENALECFVVLKKLSPALMAQD